MGWCVMQKIPMDVSGDDDDDIVRRENIREKRPFPEPAVRIL